MFKNIERIIFEKGLKKRDIAEALGMAYNTLLLKLKGEYYFTLDEAIKLKEILETDLSVEELFKIAA